MVFGHAHRRRLGRTSTYGAQPPPSRRGDGGRRRLVRRLKLACCCQLLVCHLFTRCDGASACNPARAPPVEPTRPHIMLIISPLTHGPAGRRFNLAVRGPTTIIRERNRSLLTLRALSGGPGKKINGKRAARLILPDIGSARVESGCRSCQSQVQGPPQPVEASPEAGALRCHR